MEHNKTPSKVDLTHATAIYYRLVTKYQSAPPETKFSGARAWADINELWRAILQATGGHDTESCSCGGARHHQLLADCPHVAPCVRGCAVLLCECSVDLRFEDHGW